MLAIIQDCRVKLAPAGAVPGFARALAGEWGLAGEQEVERGPQREDVAARADFLAVFGRVDPGLLGGHEGESAAVRLFVVVGPGGAEPGHAEVDQPGLATPRRPGCSWA